MPTDAKTVSPKKSLARERRRPKCWPTGSCCCDVDDASSLTRRGSRCRTQPVGRTSTSTGACSPTGGRCRTTCGWRSCSSHCRAWGRARSADSCRCRTAVSARSSTGERCPRQVSAVLGGWAMSSAGEQCPRRMSDVLGGWAMSSADERCPQRVSDVLGGWAISSAGEWCPRRVSDVLSGWAMSSAGERCPRRVSDVLSGWAMSLAGEQCPQRVSNVVNRWVMSSTGELRSAMSSTGETGIRPHPPVSTRIVQLSSLLSRCWVLLREKISHGRPDFFMNIERLVKTDWFFLFSQLISIHLSCSGTLDAVISLT